MSAEFRDSTPLSSLNKKRAIRNPGALLRRGFNRILNDGIEAAPDGQDFVPTGIGKSARFENSSRTYVVMEKIAY